MEKEGNGLLSSISTGLMKMFGQDEESKRRKAQKAELNRGIDEMFKGTGLAGGIMAGIAKKVGGAVMDSLKDGMSAIAEVQSRVQQAVELDGSLGSNVRIGMHIQQSSSTMNLNGIVTKNVSLVFPVEGSRGRGQVQCDASISGSDNSDVNFRSIVLITADGRQINVKGPKRGGGRVHHRRR